MFVWRSFAAVTCCLWLGLNATLAQRDSVPPQPVAATVTLTVTDRPLSQVLAEITKQTGINVESQLGDSDPKVSLECKRELFWRTLDRVAEQANARVTILPRDGRIVLSKRGAEEQKPIVSYSGPFRFCVKRITASWDLDTGARTYSAAVEVAWEPGLEPLFLEALPQGVIAIDDRGQRLPVLDGGKSQAPVDGRTSLLIDVPLPALPRTTKTLSLLEGHLEVITPSKMLRFAFPRLEKGATLSQDGVTCKITDLVLKDYRWIVQVSIQNPPGGGAEILESYQPWDTNNVLALVSKDRSKMRLIAKLSNRENQSPRRADLSYQFTDRAKLAQMKPAEWSIEYQTPARIVTMPLSFSFKDVPLP